MKYQNRVVFITSLERSGSTLLDIILGQSRDMVSFGEVARVLLPHGGGGMQSVYDLKCTCGQNVENCLFWGKVTKRISEDEERLNLKDRYEIFFDTFLQVFGSSKVPVDSSKFIGAINALSSLRDEKRLDLKVLFTVRDVRGWMSSSRKADKRKREIPIGRLFSVDIFKWWKPYLRHNILRYFPFWLPLEWYIRNKNIFRALRNNSIQYCQLSYELLVLEKVETLRKLYGYIGDIDFSESDIPEFHIVRGNRMAFDGSKNREVKYDLNWLTDMYVQYESMFWPFVVKSNIEWVYLDHDLVD